MTSPPPCPTPAIASLQALADQCVQCGLCLPGCPTYARTGIESESPRGRIALARAWETGQATPTPTGDAHLDACLGCGRCEAVCPAGVRYGAILVGARRRQRDRRPPGWRQRLAETLAARPRIRAGLFSLYRRLWPWLPPSLRPLPRPHARLRTPAAPAPPTSGVQAPPEVAIFTGCIARHYEGPTRDAVSRLLEALGMRARFHETPMCCGTLHAHAGDSATAATLNGQVRDAFRDAAIVLGLASGCHGALRAALGTRAVDAIAFFAGHADALTFAPRRERVALHLPCTQRNVAHSDAALRGLLARVPDLQIVVLDEDASAGGFGCCGAAGSAMLTDPVRAAGFRQPLLDQLAGSGATRLLSANIGCRLHLGNGTGLPVSHPLEFLAGCLR